METPKLITAHAIVKDGFLGKSHLPAYRVVTVLVDEVSGKAVVERSSQSYVIDEALAIIEDKQNEALGL